MGSRIRYVLAAVVAAAIVAPAADAGATNRIVFVSDRADGQRELYAVNRDGTGERRLTFNGIVERGPDWSPSGDRIAFAGLVDGNWDIYTIDANGRHLTRVTVDAARDDYPQWTADGRIVFQRNGGSCPCAAWIANADGTHEHQLPLKGNVLTPAPAPGGYLLAYASDVGGSWSLRVATLDGRFDRAITSGPSVFGDFNPRWSPDGTRIAFLRDHTGVDNDVFVVRPDGAAVRQLTDTPDRIEYWPSWARSGAELLFAETDGGPSRLRVIKISTGAESAVSTSPSAPLSDDFSDGTRDASLWHVISDPGSTLAEQNGRLEIRIAAGSAMTAPWNQVEAHYGAQCALPGDYDMRVDYQLLEWPAVGYYAALSAFFTTAFVARQADPWAGQVYVGWIGGDGNFVPTADMSGTLRLVRSGETVSAFVRPRRSFAWAHVYSGPAPGDAVYGIGLTAPGNWYSGGVTTADASVAFDNFQLASGALECPDWWSDFGGDLQ